MSQAKYIFAIAVGWLAISVAPLWKYLSHPRAIAVAIFGVLLVTAGMACVRHLNQRETQLSYVWFVALYFVMVAATVFLHSFLLRHTLNAGSDREDALRICLDALRHHQYPYAARTYLNNPPTPLPGALLLAAPFYAVGHIMWQNLFWVAAFFLLCLNVFRQYATSLFFLFTFLLCTPVNLNDLVTGGDYLINFIYVAVAIVLFVRMQGRRWAVALPATIFLGVAVSSRALYPLAMIPLLPLTLQRTTIRRTAALFATMFTATAAVTLPVFFPHPVDHLLSQLTLTSANVTLLPHNLHPAITLPLLAAAILCTSFWLKMDLQRLALLFALATTVILAPPVIALAFAHQTHTLAYLSVPALAFSFWLMSRFEYTTCNSVTNA